MDFSLPSKKKKKKKVILTEGDDLPTEEGGKFIIKRESFVAQVAKLAWWKPNWF